MKCWWVKHPLNVFYPLPKTTKNTLPTLWGLEKNASKKGTLSLTKINIPVEEVFPSLATNEMFCTWSQLLKKEKTAALEASSTQANAKVVQWKPQAEPDVLKLVRLRKTGLYHLFTNWTSDPPVKPHCSGAPYGKQTIDTLFEKWWNMSWVFLMYLAKQKN